MACLLPVDACLCRRSLAAENSSWPGCRVSSAILLFSIMFQFDPGHMRQWRHILLLGAAALGALVIILRPWDTPVARAPAAPSHHGWARLLPCSDTASMDGSKTLTLDEDHSAKLVEGDPAHAAAGKTTVEGEWRFDRGRGLYSVTLNGKSTSYSIESISAGPATVCALIKGDLGAADLRSSWFSSPEVDDRSDPGDYPGP